MALVAAFKNCIGLQKPHLLPPTLLVRAQTTGNEGNGALTQRGDTWRLDPFGEMGLWRRPRSIFESFDRIERQLEKEFEGFFGFRAPAPRAQMPVDFIEDEKSYSLELDIPGIQKGDLKVSVDDDILTIVAERNEDKEWESSTFHRKERSFGKLQRSVMIPSNADAESITAKYDNGVLQISMQKLKDSEVKRENLIDIEFGDTKAQDIEAQKK
eukprot:CAMPEP_0117747904 /NCGR_PEP_ID=MMETSP0947-20121206/8774_1 /TAXON_ID=44440 /ORGANISM="Chattonella subsalsa, Strain CCMP2191" /LENGTH=212 /DNA_ID=CAMNT_0005565417 /DNA_START=190 /DNA_END=828 /DNA_ORIENTATION=-